MNTIPYVGQHVRLNDFALRDCGVQLLSRQEFKDSEDMIITDVVNVGSSTLPIWAINVDKPSINKFLLYSEMVDPLETTGYAAVYVGDAKVYERGTRSPWPVEHASEYDSDMD